MQLWSEKKPSDLRKDQLLLWRTEHRKFGNKMRMTGLVREMNNGWTDTRHLLPPMTRWDGYKHIIPDGLEWSADVPERIAEIEFTRQTAYKVNQLVSVDGIELMACPFTGEPATWESRDGFIGSMAYQDNQFSVGGALRTGFFSSPQKCADFWNRRSHH
jgi:hypothetical protein